MDNIQSLFETCVKYATPDLKTIMCGEFFELRHDAPSHAKDAFVQYITILRKALFSYDFVIIENKKIKDFIVTEENKEQIDIIKKLINKGILKI